VIDTALAVPSFEDEKIASSTLILADQMSQVAAKDLGVGAFVIGSTKVRPKPDQTFANDQDMGVFVQFYNLKVDDQTHKNKASVDVDIFQGNTQVGHVTRTGDELHQTGDEITLQQMVSMKPLMPGKYRVDVKVNDTLANQTLTKSADFTV